MSQNVENYLMANSKNLPQTDIPQIRSLLSGLDESKQSSLSMISTKDPVITLLLAVFLGLWGVDRFILGQVGSGILKIITFGGFGIWYLIDIFTAIGRTKNYNKEKLMLAIG